MGASLWAHRPFYFALRTVNVLLAPRHLRFAEDDIVKWGKGKIVISSLTQVGTTQVGRTQITPLTTISRFEFCQLFGIKETV